MQALCGESLTSEMLTRPSWKEQSLAFWVHMWRYLHQWHGNEPFTQERQLEQREAGDDGEGVSRVTDGYQNSV